MALLFSSFRKKVKKFFICGSSSKDEQEIKDRFVRQVLTLSTIDLPEDFGRLTKKPSKNICGNTSQTSDTGVSIDVSYNDSDNKDNKNNDNDSDNDSDNDNNSKERKEFHNIEDLIDKFITDQQQQQQQQHQQLLKKLSDDSDSDSGADDETSDAEEERIGINEVYRVLNKCSRQQESTPLPDKDPSSNKDHDIVNVNTSDHKGHVTYHSYLDFAKVVIDKKENNSLLDEVIRFDTLHSISNEKISICMDDSFRNSLRGDGYEADSEDNSDWDSEEWLEDECEDSEEVVGGLRNAEYIAFIRHKCYSMFHDDADDLADELQSLFEDDKVDDGYIEYSFMFDEELFLQELFDDYYTGLDTVPPKETKEAAFDYEEEKFQALLNDDRDGEYYNVVNPMDGSLIIECPFDFGAEELADKLQALFDADKEYDYFEYSSDDDGIEDEFEFDEENIQAIFKDYGIDDESPYDFETENFTAAFKDLYNPYMMPYKTPEFDPDWEKKIIEYPFEYSSVDENFDDDY